MKLNAPAFLLISVFLSFHLLSIAQEKETTVKEEETIKKAIKFFAGFHGGPSYCNYYTNEYAILKQYILTPRAGYIAGFFTQGDITPRWAWNIELNYELTTYTMTPDKTLRNLPYTGPYYYYNHSPLSRAQVNNNLVQVPISLKYKITTARTALFISTGGYISTNLRSSTTNVYGNKKEPSGYSYEKDWTNPRGIQYGTVGGLGLDSRLNKRLHLIVEIRDQVALNNIKNERTNVIGLLAGLMYQ